MTHSPAEPTPTRVAVAGVDHCNGGWVAVILVPDEAKPRAQVYPSLATCAAGLDGVHAIADEVPIGLPAPGSVRRADKEARAILGGRWTSVFHAPPRRLLDETTQAAANVLVLELRAPGLSAQGYGLRNAILDAQDVAAADDRIIEVHPEVGFRAMAQRPLAWSKMGWASMNERISRLAAHGIVLPADLGATASKVLVDDVLDAAAAAWSAQRVAAKEAISLPTPPEILGGRAVAIWY